MKRGGTYDDLYEQLRVHGGKSGLVERTANCLARAGYLSTKWHPATHVLEDATDEDLLSIVNFGVGCLKLLRHVIPGPPTIFRYTPFIGGPHEGRTDILFGDSALKERVRFPDGVYEGRDDAMHYIGHPDDISRADA